MKRFLILLAWLVMVIGVLALAGCASTPAPVVVPKEVLTPVAACPVPELGPRPQLPVAYLTEQTPYDDKERAYVQSLDLLTTYAAGLEQMLRKIGDKTGASK